VAGRESKRGLPSLLEFAFSLKTRPTPAANALRVSLGGLGAVLIQFIF